MKKILNAEYSFSEEDVHVELIINYATGKYTVCEPSQEGVFVGNRINSKEDLVKVKLVQEAIEFADSELSKVDESLGGWTGVNIEQMPEEGIYLTHPEYVHLIRDAKYTDGEHEYIAIGHSVLKVIGDPFTYSKQCVRLIGVSSK